MVRRAIFWTFSGQVANFVVQFGASVAIARLLSPTEMGIYGIAWSVIGIVQIFTSFNVGAYVVRERELDQQTLDTAYTINLLLSIALSSVIFISSYFAGSFLGNPMVDKVLKVLALTPLIGTISFRPTVMLQRSMQMRGISIVGTIGTVVASVVSVTAAFQGQGSLSPAYGALASAICGATGSVIIARQHQSARMSLKRWRPIAEFGIRMMSIGGIASAAVRVSDIILGRLLGLAALGLYNRASNLSNMLFTNVYGSATRVVFAKLSESQRDQDRLSEVFERSLKLILGVMAPLDLSLAVLSRPIIYNLYGQKWLGAALPFSLLMIAQLISLSFAMNWELFVVRNELKTQTKLELVRSIVGVISQTVGCLISLVAVAASSIFDALVSVLLYQRHLVRLTRFSQSRLYKIYIEALALSVAAAAPSLVLMIVVSWNAKVNFIVLIAAIMAGISLWTILLVTIKHPLVSEGILLTRFIISRGPKTM